MKNRTTTSALLIATLAVSGLAGGTLAQEPSEPADDAATTKSATGTVVAVVDEDGNTGYFLDVDGTLIELSYGPSWFWGEGICSRTFWASPTPCSVDSSVTVRPTRMPPIQPRRMRPRAQL